jgi:hypothetical protein
LFEPDVKSELQRIVATFKKRFLELTKHECPDMPADFLSQAPEKSRQAVASDSQQQGSPPGSNLLQPVLATFDENVPRKVLSEQQVAQTLETQEIDWTIWAHSQNLANKVCEKIQHSAAAMVCSDLWINNPVTAKLKWQRPVEHGVFSRWKVLAGDVLQPKQLLMVPYIAGPEKLSTKKCLSPDAIVVTVQYQGASTCFWVKSDICSQSAEWVKTRGEDKMDNFSRSMFWACHRSHKEAEFNCELVDMQSSIVVCSQWNGIPDAGREPTAVTTVVTVPVLVNTKKIEQGSEIIVKCSPPQKAEKPEKKARNWVTDAMRSFKEPEKASSSSGV